MLGVFKAIALLSPVVLVSFYFQESIFLWSLYGALICVLLGFFFPLFSKKLCVKDKTFKKTMKFFLRVAWVFIILKTMWDLISPLAEETPDYSFLGWESLVVYVLPYVIYLVYKKIYIGKIFGRW